MPETKINWKTLNIQDSTELIVGWRKGRAHLDAGAVELSKEVAKEIHGLCLATTHQFAKLTRRSFGGSPYIEVGEQYLAVPVSKLPRAEAPAPPGDSGPDTDERQGISDLERLIRTPGMTNLSREEIQKGNYLFYAAICTTAKSNQRIGFVKQMDPHRAAKQGGLIARFADGLQAMEDPIFILEAGFDMVVAEEEVAVLRLEAFNRLFADLRTIMAAAPANVEAIAGELPSFSPGAATSLASAAASRPSLARRVQRLRKPGALPKVTAEQVSAALSKHGLDPALIVNGSEINFTEENATIFLDLLEQLYYETDFTQEHRRADRYSDLHGPTKPTEATALAANDVGAK